jgi:hypothetical protein
MEGSGQVSCGLRGNFVYMKKLGGYIPCMWVQGGERDISQIW